VTVQDVLPYAEKHLSEVLGSPGRDVGWSA
jgi:hypothetical protein